MSGGGGGDLSTTLNTCDKGAGWAVRMRWGPRGSSQPRVWGEAGGSGRGEAERGLEEFGTAWPMTARY